jgi:hypothetical protein
MKPFGMPLGKEKVQSEHGGWLYGELDIRGSIRGGSLFALSWILFARGSWIWP